VEQIRAVNIMPKRMRPKGVIGLIITILEFYCNFWQKVGKSDEAAKNEQNGNNSIMGGGSRVG
jgi:hypothetical protein